MFSFCKMQATGNDFIILNYLEEKLDYSYKLLSEFLCDRRFGIGADGLIIIENSKSAEYKMRIFNKDGSEAEMCGNGIRCLAKFIYDKNQDVKEEFKIETKAGIKKVKIKKEEIKVDMGEPIFDLNEIPVFFQEEDYDGKVRIDEKEFYLVSLGNPHAVCFTEDVKKIDIEKIGKKVENYKYFPNKINVEFVQIVNNNKIIVRIWERGVGETLSCGTGVCAASVISKKYKSTESRLTVETKGGILHTENNNKNIILSGPAQIVFEGKIKI